MTYHNKVGDLYRKYCHKCNCKTIFMVYYYNKYKGMRLKCSFCKHFFIQFVTEEQLKSRGAIPQHQNFLLVS